MARGVHLPALSHLSFRYNIEDGKALEELASMLNRSRGRLDQIRIESTPEFEFLFKDDFRDKIKPVIREKLYFITE